MDGIWRVVFFWLLLFSATSQQVSSNSALKIVTIDDLNQNKELFDKLHVCIDGIFSEYYVESKLGILVDPPYLNYKGNYRKRINLNFRLAEDPEALPSVVVEFAAEDIDKHVKAEVSVCGLYKSSDRMLIVNSLRRVDLNILH